MAQKSFDQIKWATPEKPRGLWANCVICNKDIRENRSRKCTCSEECALIHQHNIWNKQYAEKMSKDLDFAKKQSAKQYARIKADPEKLEAKRIAQNERMQLPNYKESARRSEKKYKSKPESKQKIATRMRKYRDENMELIAEIEARRTQKRSEERQRLKSEEPEKYAELLESEREAERKRRAEKRLVELQKDMNKLVNKDE